MNGRATSTVRPIHAPHSFRPTSGHGLTSLIRSRLSSFCKYRNLLIDETMTPFSLRVATCLLPLLIVVCYKIWTIRSKYSRMFPRHYTNYTIAEGTYDYWTRIPSRDSGYQAANRSNRRPHHCTDSPIHVDIDITPLVKSLPLGAKIALLGAAFFYAFYRVFKIHNPDRRFLGLP